ncbi:zinc-dependent metalloprotease family protein [Knoellia sp. CPCC 206453]|uniref:zinc-dependent metalloprotease family protein n=1 Tax=Knoellia pratensis TaxID=3404796 RepID=UPI003614C3AD
MSKLSLAVIVGASAALIIPAAGAVAAPSASDPAPGQRGVAALIDRPTPGAQAGRLFAGRIDELARHNGLPATQLREILASDRTSWVDEDARLYYVEPMSPEMVAQAASRARANTRRPPKPPQPPTGAGPIAPALSSLPGASRVIYIDFNGHTISGTAWNANGGPASVNVTPYDTDGAPATFSAAENAVITETWQRIAEDYAPFNVNVTTVDPGADAINRSSSTDLNYGTRLLVDPTSWYQAGCGCGGVAYVGVFDSANSGYNQPALVFTQGVGTGAKNIAEAGSHEVGHNLGLSHDGTSAIGYYRGHGAWAPIMGVGYSKAISQWSKGEYADANQLQDDIVVMGQNGAGVKAADHGTTAATATAITPGATVNGVTTTAADVDHFRVQLSAGSHTFTASPAAVGGNVDIELAVLDSAGGEVGKWNPASGQTSASTATGLGAAGTLNLAAGTYYVRVDGSGFADPLTTGYTAYGSIGAFSVRVD